MTNNATDSKGRGPEWWRQQAICHPLLAKHNRIPLWTPPVERFYARAKWLILQRHSFYVDEPTGEGKSAVASALVDRIQRDLGDIVTIVYCTQNKQGPSVRSFFKGFLDTVGSPSTSGETWDLQARARRRLIALASETTWRTILLVIDEAQALLVDDLEFAKDIQNQLEREHIDLVVALFGESPMLELVSASAGRAKHHACFDRFTHRRIPIDGYDRESLSCLLRMMDASIWPAGSGLTWPCFFYPQATARGFIFEHQAGRIWHALKEAKLIRSYDNDTVVARRIFELMGYVAANAEHYDTDRPDLDDQLWMDAALFCAGEQHV